MQIITTTISEKPQWNLLNKWPNANRGLGVGWGVEGQHRHGKLLLMETSSLPLGNANQHKPNSQTPRDASQSKAACLLLHMFEVNHRPLDCTNKVWRSENNFSIDI